MNTLLAILKVADARRDLILAGRLCHRSPWRHLPLPPPASNRLVYFLNSGKYWTRRVVRKRAIVDSITMY